jgi:hypothetical protein
VLNTLTFEVQANFLAGCTGIEVTQALDIAAIPTFTRIGYYHVIKGALLGTTTSKSNCDHLRQVLEITWISVAHPQQASLRAKINGEFYAFMQLL